MDQNRRYFAVFKAAIQTTGTHWRYWCAYQKKMFQGHRSQELAEESLPPLDLLFRRLCFELDNKHVNADRKLVDQCPRAATSHQYGRELMTPIKCSNSLKEQLVELGMAKLLDPNSKVANNRSYRSAATAYGTPNLYPEEGSDCSSDDFTPGQSLEPGEAWPESAPDHTLLPQPRRVENAPKKASKWAKSAKGIPAVGKTTRIAYFPTGTYVDDDLTRLRENPVPGATAGGFTLEELEKYKAERDLAERVEVVTRPKISKAVTPPSLATSSSITFGKLVELHLGSEFVEYPLTFGTKVIFDLELFPEHSMNFTKPSELMWVWKEAEYKGWSVEKFQKLYLGVLNAAKKEAEAKASSSWSPETFQDKVESVTLCAVTTDRGNSPRQGREEFPRYIPQGIGLRARQMDITEEFFPGQCRNCGSTWHFQCSKRQWPIAASYV